MNRKMISLLLAILAFACALLYGCGKKNETPETEAPAANVEQSVPATTAAISSYQPEGQTEITEGGTQESNAATMATIPSDNVEMGVVEGDGYDDLDDSATQSTQATQPTQTTQPTQATQPAQVTQPTQATQPPQETETATSAINLREITYDQFLAMSAEEQRAIINMFGSTEDFMTWFNVIKAIYQEENPGVEIGSGNIDLGGLLG